MEMRWGMRIAIGFALSLLLLGVVRAGVPSQAGTVEAASGGDGLADRATERLSSARRSVADGRVPLSGEGNWQVRSVTADDADLVVCLDVSVETLAADSWLGVERVQAEISRNLMDLPWRSLSVRAWDAVAARCLPLSDWAPGEEMADPAAIAAAAEVRDLRRDQDSAAVASTAAARRATTTVAHPASLVGKTVYVNAGHGWQWNGSQWRTQRPVYQGFIEDHNNAEVVTQFLIPYLEHAGATVIPMRERDWSTATMIADNDRGNPEYTTTGAWITGDSGAGYAGGTYQFAISTAGPANAVATWSVDVAEPGDYAVYAWVFPGDNRVPDAHYTVHHAGGSAQVLVDQRVLPNTWRYLGTFPFHAGMATVALDNRTAAGGGKAVIADALRIGGGAFDALSYIPALTTLPVNPDNPTPLPSAAPDKPWWEVSTFYWSQWIGLDPYAWPAYNDVIARPIFARWHQRRNVEDAVYISWHTNGFNGNNTTIRGTETYVHNGDTHPRTDGSLSLQAAVHDVLVRDIRLGWDSDWIDRGKRQANLGELRLLWDGVVPMARMPGVLLEIGFHDNYEDALALKEPQFNQLAARAVYKGIVGYFEGVEGRDLVLAPEPPTHLRVRNGGGGSGTLEVAWASSQTDSAGLLGDPALGYLVYSSPDGLAWGVPEMVVGMTDTVLTGFDPGETVYVKVVAFNDGGISFPSEVLGARVGDPHLLIVSGFDKLNRFSLVEEVDPVEKWNLRMWLDQMNSRDYVVNHGQATPAAMAWDSTSNEAVAAHMVPLSAYGIVNWILGEETTSVDGTLNATERALLEAYLNQDGALLISGSELGWELVELGAAPDFFREILRAEYVADDAGTYTVRPTSDGIFTGLTDQRFDAPGMYRVGYPDVLAPADGARLALRYVGGAGDGQGAAVQVADGCQRILVFGFPLETLWEAGLAEVMGRAIEFLGVCAVGPQTVIDIPTDGAGYRFLSGVAGKAVGSELSTVWLQLARLSSDRANQRRAWTPHLHTDVDAYWTGEAWGSTEAWFPAVGTATWTYDLPSLEEGVYRLQAYATGHTVGPDTEQGVAEATFFVDWTPPLTPTVITPTAGVTVVGPVVFLDWGHGPDAGSPVHFELTIDERTVVADAPPGVEITPYRVSPVLGPGDHRWQLRSVDAAGNVSPYSAWALFHVEVAQVFLPLVVRD